MIRAVVFDLDGTLLDTIPDIAGALNHALASCGLPTHPVRVCESFVGGGIREAIRKAAPDGASQELLDRILKEYLGYYPLHCTEETACYPGISELLARFAARNIALGVLSNKTERTAQQIIAAYFPHVPFRCVLGRVDGRPLKPDPAAAVPVMEALRYLPSQIAYVGDSGTDMAFARAAGFLPVAVPWGYRDRRELEAGGAAIMIERPKELAEFI